MSWLLPRTMCHAVLSRKRPKWARESSYEVRYVWPRLCLGRTRHGGRRGAVLGRVSPCDGGGPASDQCIPRQGRVRQLLRHGPRVRSTGEDRLLSQLDGTGRQDLLLLDRKLETGLPQEPRRERPE